MSGLVLRRLISSYFIAKSNEYPRGAAVYADYPAGSYGAALGNLYWELGVTWAKLANIFIER